MYVRDDKSRGFPHCCISVQTALACANQCSASCQQFLLRCYFYWYRGQDNSVSIATRYGLDGPEIESRCGRDFLGPSRPDLEPTQSPAQRVQGLSRG